MNTHERASHLEKRKSVYQRKGSTEGVRAERDEGSLNFSHEAHQSFGKKHKDERVDVIILVPEGEKKDTHTFPKEKRSFNLSKWMYPIYLSLGTVAASFSVLPIKKTFEAYQYGMAPEFLPLDWTMLAFTAGFALFLITRAVSKSGSSSRVTGHARRKIFEERDEKESF